MRKRTKEIKIRLTPDEHAQFMARVPDGAALAEWVRNTCLGVPPAPKRKIKKADSDLLIALARIGNNMNQIARELNTNNDTATVARAMLELAQIRAQLDQVLEAHL